MGELEGQVALVTGCAAPNGIGRAISHRLAADGASVIVSDLDGGLSTPGGDTPRQSLLEDLQAELEARGTQALFLTLDVTSESSVAKAVADAKARFGRVDILVNNAGSIAGVGPFLDQSPDQWRMSFAVNLLGPMMLSQAVIPMMEEHGGGRIINIGSTGSLGAAAGFGAYTTMKHGMLGMTKMIAAEFGTSGILCNTVCPGFISTDMHEAANTRIASETGASLEETRARRYADVALRRPGKPDEVAEAVAFLAGPRGSYITGASLPVSGGVPPGL